jgi:HPr kinase/phosphorylase
MFTVTLKEIADEFQLEVISFCKKPEEVLIKTVDVNRPGLQLSGYLEHFGEDRIQVFGMAEISFLSSLSSEERFKRLDDFFKFGFPCMVVARNLEVFPEMISVSEKYCVPILKTEYATSHFISSLIRYLNLQLAPRDIKHGVLIEVYGEGILILGDSGVGKSETALELVKRGHRLVADDVVEIRRVSDKTLLGNAPEIIRYMMEIRGIGILDIKNLYGVGSIKPQENINLIINIEIWDNSKNYDRLGLIDEYTDILGVSVPSITIPVRPGRNLAIVIEVAAMNHRQKKMGYNAAQIINERIMRLYE